jgi:RimJ/RimL family protein N-acetyltransferase
MEANHGMGDKSSTCSVGRVQLRNFCLADLDDLYEWASDEEVTKFMILETFKSKEKLREFLVKVVIPHQWFKAICFNGKPIGHVMLKQGTGIQSCRAEMGYAIARKYWRMGFTTQAVITTLKMGFKELQGLKRIEALVPPENVASARVLEKAGFVKEGFLRNYVHVKGTVRDCLLFSYVV